MRSFACDHLTDEDQAQDREVMAQSRKCVRIIAALVISQKAVPVHMSISLVDNEMFSVHTVGSYSPIKNNKVLAGNG